MGLCVSRTEEAHEAPAAAAIEENNPLSTSTDAPRTAARRTKTIKKRNAVQAADVNVTLAKHPKTPEEHKAIECVVEKNMLFNGCDCFFLVVFRPNGFTVIHQFSQVAQI